MPLETYTISDTSNDFAANIYPAYWGQAYLNSPSGNYVAGMYTGTTTSTAYVVDTSVRSPVKSWEADLYLGTVPGYEIAVFPNPLALDDQGSLWADSQNDDGNIIEYPLAGLGTPTAPPAFTFTNVDGYSNGLTATQMYTPKTSGGAIKVIIVPGGTVGHDNPNVFVGTKGTPGLTKYTTDGTWVVWDCFLDDNDDIWVAGAPPASLGLAATMKLWRLTDVTGTSPYPSLQTITMPSINRMPRGYFKDGSYIGGWGDTGSSVNWLFAVNLTTSALTTRDMTATPVRIGDDGVRMTVPTNPTAFYFIDGNVATNRRTLIEITPTLVDGTNYSLDDWTVEDGPVVDQDATTSTVRSPLYLDGQTAFVGTRRWEPAADDNQGDLILYDFGTTGGSGPGEEISDQDDLARLRVWGFSLDGHDFYVLRVGPSETLVYDLTTGKWSSWESPAQTKWRAHLGQNWIGMSATTMARDFNSDVVAGDDTTGTLWVLDPTSGQDDNTDTGSTAFNRVVTGGLLLSGRDVMPCGAVTLDLAVGTPTIDGTTILLEVSDDLAKSWVNCGSVALATNDNSAVVEWRGLGTMSAPGRVFRLTDTGATCRIGAMNLR